MKVAIDTPDNEDDDTENGVLNNFLRSAFKKYPDVHALSKQIFKKIKERETLDFLREEKKVGDKRLHNLPIPLHEFQIPKHRDGGVGRIYYVFDKNDHKRIILLEAELKRGSASVEKITAAQKKYKAIRWKK